MVNKKIIQPTVRVSLQQEKLINEQQRKMLECIDERLNLIKAAYSQVQDDELTIPDIELKYWRSLSPSNAYDSPKIYLQKMYDIKNNMVKEFSDSLLYYGGHIQHLETKTNYKTFNLLNIPEILLYYLLEVTRDNYLLAFKNPEPIKYVFMNEVMKPPEQGTKSLPMSQQQDINESVYEAKQIINTPEPINNSPEQLTQVQQEVQI